MLDRAFGPNRHRRTAYQVRRGTTTISQLSFAAISDAGQLLGTIQCWPVVLCRDDGGDVPMIMVGPVAVDPELQRAGLGRALMQHMLDAAPTSGVPGSGALMLIGDPEYYTRFFGFSAERTAGWRLPGPYEQRRLLARGSAVPDSAGIIAPCSRQAA
nr:N-acetyltransferase [Sphingomonas xinjiangensis]